MISQRRIPYANTSLLVLNTCDLMLSGAIQRMGPNDPTMRRSSKLFVTVTSESPKSATLGVKSVSSRTFLAERSCKRRKNKIRAWVRDRVVRSERTLWRIFSAWILIMPDAIPRAKWICSCSLNGGFAVCNALSKEAGSHSRSRTCFP
jgi:hypothetical protein